jgi:excisionase family DNA binding protein
MSTIQDSQKLFTYSQAAELLGMHPASIRRFVMNGTIEHFKIGKAVRFSREQLLDRNKVESKV